MTSKAEKKRHKKATHTRLMRGSQNAGRPRQDGERYACGKLKPRKNERVIEAKRALVGKDMDIALADDPLDFIHAKGWLSTPRYRTALAYRDIRARARLSAPGLAACGLAETSSTSGIEGSSFHEMTDAEICAVFDHVFRDAPTLSAEEREAHALQQWKRLEAAMTPAQAHQVNLICVQLSWSFWMTELNMGRELVGRRVADRLAFEGGLDAMRAVLRQRPERATGRAFAA